MIWRIEASANEELGSPSRPVGGAHREAALGQFIDTATYDSERSRRGADGGHWPTASALSRAYGHWVVAVRAAMRLWFDRGRARVASDHTHARGRERFYRQEDVDTAVARCRSELGVEAVTEWEYEQWRVLSRQAARRAGQEMPRLPAARVIRRLRGGWVGA